MTRPERESVSRETPPCIPALALIRDFGKRPRQIPPQPALRAPRAWATFALSLSKKSLYGDSMARRLQRLPDYFTEEEAGALVNAAPSYPARMGFRIMLRTGLRVSEALALRRVDLRLDQDPPIIIIRADSPGNKARKGREVPVPADLLESLAGPGVVPQQEPLPADAEPVAPADRPGDERCSTRGRDRPRQGPPARLPAHLRPQLRAAGRSDSRAAEMAGPLVVDRHAALRRAGRRASRMG